MYTLYIANRNYSSWSLRGWLAMMLSRAPFSEVMVPLSATGTPNPANLAFSPTARVPCLHDGETVVWDSLAIAEYLAERHPGMWPADPVTRAWARSVCAEMHSGFSALRNDMTMCIRERVDVRPWSAALERDVARVVALWNEGRRRFGRGGPFLCGDFPWMTLRTGSLPVPYDGVPDGAAGYLKALLAHPLLRQWEDAALKETEIIEADEPRLIYRDKLAAKGGAKA
jgi:glutathione S-transferase